MEASLKCGFCKKSFIINDFLNCGFCKKSFIINEFFKCGFCKKTFIINDFLKCGFCRKSFIINDFLQNPQFNSDFNIKVWDAKVEYICSTWWYHIGLLQVHCRAWFYMIDRVFITFFFSESCIQILLCTCTHAITSNLLIGNPFFSFLTFGFISAVHTFLYVNF